MSKLKAVQELVNGLDRSDKGLISDGYHSFEELYEFRKLYNALLFNEWAKLGKYQVHKSFCHFDGGECFGGGWFIVAAMLPSGLITNHYRAADWDLFNVPSYRRSIFPYDDHTGKDSIDRMETLLQSGLQ